MEMGQTLAEIRVSKSEYVSDKVVLDWEPKDDEFLNEFFACSMYGEWGIFARPPQPLSIYVERDNGFLQHMGTWEDGKWRFTILRDGEELQRELQFRITQHFNLRPGDKIRITLVN